MLFIMCEVVCNNRRVFIRMILAVAFLLKCIFTQQTFCPVDKSSGQSGLEYNDPYYEGKLKCLYFIAAEVSWKDASEYCYQNIKIPDQADPKRNKYSGVLAAIHTHGKFNTFHY